MQAPEIIRMEPDAYSQASDVYAYGIVLYEILSRQLPYGRKKPEQVSAGAGAHAVLTSDRFCSWSDKACSSPTSRLLGQTHQLHSGSSCWIAMLETNAIDPVSCASYLAAVTWAAHETCDRAILKRLDVMSRIKRTESSPSFSPLNSRGNRFLQSSVLAAAAATAAPSPSANSVSPSSPLGSPKLSSPRFAHP